MTTSACGRWRHPPVCRRLSRGSSVNEALTIRTPRDTSPLNTEKRPGTFRCAGCGEPLFDSATKYESGSGWPSFWQPMPGAVGTSTDGSHFMTRTEVHCAQCGGHLGHVFPDGPKPTGQRYCMNGAALKFDAKK